MTSSPFLTLKGARSPFSRRLPSPTLRTFPRLGFSLALSGRTIPLLVFDSASSRLTRILSPRGRSLGMIGSPVKKVDSEKLLVDSGSWEVAYQPSTTHYPLSRYPSPGHLPS